ncbi:hypothetical protein RGQ21_01210 [Kitasatospora aureofaciens]|nr:hypothetical protein RGQ21_01210 [Kitasatospora aureofaciens]
MRPAGRGGEGGQVGPGGFEVFSTALPVGAVTVTHCTGRAACHEEGTMAKITYKHPDGTETVLEVTAPNTVMRGAKLNNVEGIVAQCGGSAQCGTCHVYIDEGNTLPLPEMHEAEDDVLYGTAAERRPTSRLSCQLPVSEAIDGLIVHLPTTQV